MAKALFYLNCQMASELFHCSRQTFNRRLDEIDEQIRKGRYPKGAIIHGTNGRLVGCYVFADYLDKQKMLKDKYAAKHVPAFDASDYEDIIPRMDVLGYMEMRNRA